MLQQKIFIFFWDIVSFEIKSNEYKRCYLFFFFVIHVRKCADIDFFFLRNNFSANSNIHIRICKISSRLVDFALILTPTQLVYVMGY